MNEQPTSPVVPQPTDQNKDLADAALQAASINVDAPVEQPTVIAPPVNEDSVVSDVEGVESTLTPSAPSTPIEPPVTEATSSPVTENTVSSTPPMGTIPVNDNTSVNPDGTPVAPTSESFQEPNNLFGTQVEIPTVPSENPFATGSSAPVQQMPVQSEGFIAKILHLFKK